MSDDTIHNAPLYKVELTDCCGKLFELYAFCSTKWVKQFFRVAVETALIFNMHGKSHDTNLFRFGVFRYKPLYTS
jgi:hypothetical protein